MDRGKREGRERNIGSNLMIQIDTMYASPFFYRLFFLSFFIYFLRSTWWKGDVFFYENSVGKSSIELLRIIFRLDNG